MLGYQSCHIIIVTSLYFFYVIHLFYEKYMFVTQINVINNANIMLKLLVKMSLNFGQHTRKHIIKQIENKRCNTVL